MLALGSGTCEGQNKQLDIILGHDLKPLAVYVKHLFRKGITLPWEGKLLALVYGFWHMNLTTQASVTLL